MSNLAREQLLEIIKNIFDAASEKRDAEAKTAKEKARLALMVGDYYATTTCEIASQPWIVCVGCGEATLANSYNKCGLCRIEEIRS